MSLLYRLILTKLARIVSKVTSFLVAVMASLIGGAILTDWLLFPFLRNTWLWILGKIAWLVEGLLREYSIPGWVVLFGGVLLVLAPLGVIGVIKIRQRFGHRKEVAQKPYVADMVDGVLWRWRWNANGEAVELRCYCQECDAQLLPRDFVEFDERFSRSSHLVYTKLICDHCPAQEPDNVREWERRSLVIREGLGCVRTIVRGNQQEIWDATIREIYRRARNRQRQSEMTS